MRFIWETPGITALELNEKLKAEGKNYEKNLYAYLTRCIKKGYVERRDPDYHCYPLVSPGESRTEALGAILRKLFHNSPSALVETLISERPLTKEEADKIRLLIKRFGEEQQK